MQKSVIFVKKNLKINIRKKFRDHCHYTGEYRGACMAYVISNIV